MFRAHLAAFAAATVTLICSACGGGGEKVPDTTTQTAAALCASACDNAGKAACDSFNPNCASDCETAFADMPKACSVEVQKVFVCYAEQTVICGGDHAPSFPACAHDVQALALCVQANAEPDPTYGGRCLPTSSTPENSETYCGATAETPLLYECTGGTPPRAGCVTEPTGGADLYCCPEL